MTTTPTPPPSPHAALPWPTAWPCAQHDCGGVLLRPFAYHPDGGGGGGGGGGYYHHRQMSMAHTYYYDPMFDACALTCGPMPYLEPAAFGLVYSVSRVGTADREAEQQQQQQPAARQMDTLSAGGEAHLRKVWAITGANVGVASGGAIFGMTAAGLSVPILVPALGSLVPLVGLYMTDPKTSSPALRTGLMGTFAFMTGWATGPLIGMSLAMDPMILPMALGTTAGIFGSMTALSLVLPSGSMQKWGAPLGGGMLVIFGAGLVSLFYPHPALQSLTMYGGLALFTAFIAYDTQRILWEYEQGQRDALTHSVDMFINLVGIFRRVLILFMNRD